MMAATANGINAMWYEVRLMLVMTVKPSGVTDGGGDGTVSLTINPGPSH